MVRRKGLGKGKGKGYKNIAPKDPKVHSQSAKGVKQPQRLSPRVKSMIEKNPKLKGKSFKQLQQSGVFLKYQGDADKDGVPNIKDCKPLDKTKHKDEAVTEIEFDPTVEGEITRTQRLKGKAGAFIKKEARAGTELLKKKIKEKKEQKKKERIKELEEIRHPLTKELDKQKARVDEVRLQIAITQDEAKEEKLFDELAKEQTQLREVQEKITELKVEDLSDSELKTLAIRYKDDSLFGFGDNPYTKELKRRIMAEKTIEKELDEERKKKADTGGFFGL